MTQATLNGHVYSDDGSAARDMQGGGVRNWLLPMMADAVVEINIAKAAQVYATQAANYAAALHGTSTTSVTVAAGAHTITTQPSKQFIAGQYVMISRQSVPGIRMWGTVTSYNSTTGELVFNAITAAGSGSYNDWQIGLSGEQGEDGPAARAYVSYKNTTYTVTLADIGNTIDCAGSWTLSLTAAATLGDGYYVWVRNTGSGTITIDPSGAETIDGAVTYTLNAGHYCLLICDGSNWLLGLSGLVELQLRNILSNNTGWVAVSNSEVVGESVTHGDSVAQTRAHWTGSLFLLYGGAGSNVATSPDGVTWTLRTLPASMTVAAIANIGNIAVVVQNSSTAAARSSDGGVTWSSLTLPASLSNPSLGVVGGLFVLTGSSTGSTYYTSSDGLTWTSRTWPASTQWTLTYGTVGGLMLAGADASTTYYTSPDGLTWTSRTLPAASPPGTGWRRGSSYYTTGTVARYVSGVTMYETTDGINWSSPGASPISNYLPIEIATGVWLCVRNSDYLYTGASITGPWTQRSNLPGTTLALGYTSAINNAGVLVSGRALVGAATRIATDQTVYGLFAGA